MERIKRGTLRGYLFKFIGIFVSVLLVVTGGYFTITTYLQSRSSAENQNQMQSQVNAIGPKMRIYRAIGAVRTMSVSADEIFSNSNAFTDSVAFNIVSSMCHRINSYNDITLYKAAYFSLNRKFLPHDGSEGRILYWATSESDDVRKLVQSGLDPANEVDKCIEKSEMLQQTTISVPHKSIREKTNSSASLVLTVTAPIVYKGEVVGSAGLDLPLEQFQRMISKASIPEGASTYLISHDGTIVAHTDPKNVGKSALTVMDTSATRIFDIIFKEKDASKNVYTSTNNSITHLAVPVNMDQAYTTWVQGISIPNSVIYKESHDNLLITILVILLGVSISLIVSFQLSKKITMPINSLSESIKRLARGEIKETKHLEIKSNDEIGEMGSSVNKLISSLNNAAEFAHEIGNENFDYEFKGVDDSDELAQSLRDMRESLVHAKKIEEKRKAEEKRTLWFNEGVGKFSEILQHYHDDLNELSYQMLSNLIKYIDADQGGIYILDEDKEYLEQTAAFAYDRKKLLQKRVNKDEGLLGRCIYEGQSIFLKEVPADYLTITSGLGDSKPSCLLLVPIKSNEEICGIIEIASIRIIDDIKIKLLEKISENMGATVISVRTALRTARLLEMTKNLS